MRILLLPIYIVALCLSACGTTVQLAPQADATEHVFYADGHPVMISSKVNSVSVGLNSEVFRYNDRVTFFVGVRNMTATPIDFSPSNVTFRVGAEQSKVYSYDELVAEENRREGWQAFALGLAAAGRAMSAASAGYSTTYGTASVYSPSGSAYGTYSGTTYDPAKAAIAQQAANAETREEFSQAANEQAAARVFLQQTILKRNTVLPGQTVSGGVVADLPSPDDHPEDALVTVHLNGESYFFRFNYFSH